jgi:hypothetical protein
LGNLNNFDMLCTSCRHRMKMMRLRGIGTYF